MSSRTFAAGSGDTGLGDFGEAAPLRDLLAVPPQPVDRCDHVARLTDRRLRALVTPARLVALLRAGRTAQRWSPAHALDQIDGAAGWCDAVEAGHRRFGLPLDTPDLLRLRRFAAALPPLRALLTVREHGLDPGTAEVAFRLAAALAVPLRAQALTDRIAFVAMVRAPRGDALLWHLDRAADLLAPLAAAYGLAFAAIEALAGPFSRARGITFPLALEQDGRVAVVPARLFLLADPRTPANGRLPLLRLGLPARDSRLDDGARRGVVAGLDVYNRMLAQAGQRPVGLTAGFYDIGDPALDDARADSQIEAPLMAAALSGLSGRPSPAETLVSGRLTVADHRIAGVSARIDAALAAGCRRFLLPRINRAEVVQRLRPAADGLSDLQAAPQADTLAAIGRAGGFRWFDAAAGVADGWRRFTAAGPRPLAGLSARPEDRMPGLVRLAARLTRVDGDATGTARLDVSLQVGRMRLALPTGEAQLALSALDLAVVVDGGRLDPAGIAFAAGAAGPAGAGSASPDAGPALVVQLAGAAGALDTAAGPAWRIDARHAGQEAAWAIAATASGAPLDGRLAGLRLATVRLDAPLCRVSVRAVLLPRALLVEEAVGLLGPDDSRNKMLAVRLLVWKLLSGRLTPEVSRVTVQAGRDQP